MIIKIIETFPRHEFVVIENGAFWLWLHHLKQGMCFGTGREGLMKCVLSLSSSGVLKQHSKLWRVTTAWQGLSLGGDRLSRHLSSVQQGSWRILGSVYAASLMK